MTVQYKTFVVSLSSSPRRDFVTEQCQRNNINPIFIDAVDFRKHAIEEVAQFYQPTPKDLKKKKTLSPAEIGCALSHRKIYQKMQDENIPMALILEDDVRFLDKIEYFLSALNNTNQHIDFDIIILGYVKVTEKTLPYYYRRLPIKKIYQCGQYVLGTPWEQYGCGAVAYLVTQAGANKLLSEEKVRVAADNWLYFEQNYHLNILHVRPSVCIEACDIFDSSIRIEKENFLQPKWHSILIRSVKGILKNIAMNKLGIK